MVQLKRKVTLRTKENSEVSVPKVEGTAPKSPGAVPQPSSGGGKWWVAAVVVALLAAGGVYFVRQCGDDRTPSVATAGQNDSVVVDSAPAAASPSGEAAPAANGNAETTAAPTGETSSAKAGGETHSAAAAPATSASTAPASAAAPTKAASASNAPASASSTSTSAPTTAAAPAQAPTGSVEQTAREVMRGVYGNGQVRKDQLGSRYAKVQRRVNQIYRARRAR